MSLRPGMRLTTYDIHSLLGAGGMGEVYRAVDRRIGRSVAVKVLPAAWSADADRVARLQREAVLLAALNHPNVAGLHELEHDGDRWFLVMELVPGESLAERIARGPVPRAEALDLCRQIAAGIEAAHEKGIVHRDLKPANVRVTPEGTAKVLDFGLAKAAPAAATAPAAGAGDADATPSGGFILSLETKVGYPAPDAGAGPASGPGVAPAAGPAARPAADPAAESVGVTQDGEVLGTPLYMSPEQANGRPLDRRTDIWSFGCVLFEVLAGRRAFRGDSPSALRAAILEREPEWGDLPADLPPALLILLRRCLEKDPRRRLRDIGDARLELEDVISGGGPFPEAVLPASPRRLLPWAVAGSAAILALVAWSTRPAPPPDVAPPPPVIRFAIDPPEGHRIGADGPLAFSPDGRYLAYTIDSEVTTRLAVLALDSVSPRVIAGSDAAIWPRFSDDSRWILFSARNEVRKAAPDGDTTFTVVPLHVELGFCLTPDGSIVYSPEWASPLRVLPRDGTPSELTAVRSADGEGGHLHPHLLPGGQKVLYTVWTGGSFDSAHIDAFDLGSRERSTVVSGGACPCFVRTPSGGYLLWARAGNLLAAPFDPERAALTGEPQPVVEGIHTEASDGTAAYAVSPQGTLAYVPGTLTLDRCELVWVDRAGKETPVPAEGRPWGGPSLSADGKRFSVVVRGSNYRAHVVESATGTVRALTFAGDDYGAVLSPDGEQVAYHSNELGSYRLMLKRTDGTAPAQVLLGESVVPRCWSRDGKSLFCERTGGRRDRDVWVIGLEGGSRPRAVLEGPANETKPALSPDGRWLAYVSDQDGEERVYVESFPERSGRWQVSAAGGTSPRWSADGKELFYRDGRRFCAVAIDGEDRFAAGTPAVLFEGNYAGADSILCDYDVGPDGRFLVVKSDVRSQRRRIVVVVNWFQDLYRRFFAGGR